MNVFSLTHKLYEENSINTITVINHDVPSEVAEMLLLANSNSYANGFFKFISPSRFRPYFSMWNLNPNDCFPFIKCGFGHLIFYHQQQYKVLNPIYNCIDIIGEQDELDFVMNIILCDRQSLENSFFIDIYEQSFERLGPPQLSEIYAFVPALRLGGCRSASYVQKVNMNEQMMILSQL
ncbi:T6SS immunity protein Tdi1 domain-containing protein [Calothrix sp. NIES-2098]|uniref:T6SS immunity protein Tdi1 domain-containing protein n=1 Tax=Calothrix sp. NIES-2098 TaxID=1954171 RepID=UPI000B61CF3D|nr:hypothetical protein NIES2098_30570 [Calothrix sp. NIES-2098]